MRPNKTGIGVFTANLEEKGQYPRFQYLFKGVYKAFAFDPGNGYYGHLVEIAFTHHDCGEVGVYSAFYINENGYCTNCGKFLASHKKLEVMAALKELND